MINALDKFCDEGDSVALLKLTEKQSSLIVLMVNNILRTEEGYGDYTIEKARDILSILTKPPPHGLECPLRGLHYIGDSCYLDSSLVALFAIPNSFVHTQILAAELEERTALPEGISAEEDLDARRCVKRNLVFIANSITGNGKKVINCTNLRKAFRGCPHLENYHKTGARDSGEFLAYIFAQFPTDVAETLSVHEGVIFDAEGAKYVVETSRRTINDSSVIISIDHYHLMESWMGTPIQIGSFLRKTIETGELDIPLAVHKDGTTTYFFNVITTTTVISSPFLVFQFQRVVQEESGSESLLKTPVLPTQSVITASGDILYLSAIVVWKGSHYTCYLRCVNDWYYYNDMGGTITRVGSYKMMLKQKPSPITNCTLCFYVMG